MISPISPPMTFVLSRISLVAAFVAVGLVGSVADPAMAAKAVTAEESAQAVDLLDAMAAGDIEVKLVVKNIQQARIVARNLTKKPLTIKVPEAFAAVPVLAQGQGGGGFGGGGGRGGGGFGGGGGGGGGAFNVPPEKVVKHDVGFICLEHGKPDPRSTIEYELKPIEAQTDNPKVIELLKQMSQGRYSHQAGQAAAWHLENGLSWQALAAKRRRHANGISKPYFAPGAVRQAVQIVAEVTRLVDEKDTYQSSASR